MPHISKRKLKKEVFKQMQNRFFSHVLSLRNAASGRKLLRELLTHTEQIMLAKRFSIIFMLEEGFSVRQISYVLKVSPSTVARIKIGLDKGLYTGMVTFLKKKKHRDEMWNELERLFRGGLPPMGRGRWKWLDTLEERKGI